MKTIAMGGVLLAAAAACGQVIDFETRPDGTTPADDEALPIGTPYTVGGVEIRIGQDRDGDLTRDVAYRFERIGEDGADGFLNASLNQYDAADPGFESQLGTWFLRSPSDNVTAPLIIDYSAPVQGLSGEIWDIEGRPGGTGEQWVVEGFDASGALVSSLTSPRGTSDFEPLDGEPWTFALVGVDLTKVRIRYIGNATGVGLAFNNFNATTAIPGPTLLTHQPDLPVNDPAGVPAARLYWSEPVTVSPADVVVVTHDAIGQPVPFTVGGSGTRVTTITFTGGPGGPDTGAPFPLTLGAYDLIVRDSAPASANNAPIDGDGDGVAGGDAFVVVTHVCRADLADPPGVLDLSDINAFVESFVGGCE
jgi:hypothetical protein